MFCFSAYVAKCNLVAHFYLIWQHIKAFHVTGKV